MNTKPFAASRFSLSLLLIISILLGGIAIKAHAEDPLTTSDGQITLQLGVSYPYWYHPSIGGSQDALKFGDHASVVGIVWDDHTITNISIDLRSLGIHDVVSYPVYYNPSEHLYPYQYAFVVNSHSTGVAHVRVTVTDDTGDVLRLNQAVNMDNTPSVSRIDSTEFSLSTTSPETSTQMLVSGWIDTNETKMYAYNYDYVLYPINKITQMGGSGYFKRRPNGDYVFTDLGQGTFTDYPVEIDRDFINQRPDARFIAVRLTMRDGAGNDTVTIGPIIPLPKPVPPPGSVSNVLFLPGTEGSRLYRPADGCAPAVTNCTEEQLWDPSGDHDLQDLFLDANGASVRGDVYTKEGDTINNVSLFKFYESFAEDMDSLQEEGAMTDWEPIAYDWRLSLGDIITNGAQHGSHINYEESTSTPYIEQTLRSLAATSRTGKVTIVAHSNGGLVAKALLHKLGDEETAALVDNVILVGAPQSGAPQALAGLFHGYGAALPADWCSSWAIIGPLCSLNASRAQARTFAENAPMAYHLLPSYSYFDSVRDAKHPVVQFSSTDAYAKERAQYGYIVQNEDELASFATASEGGRTKPTPTNLSIPNILNDGLLAYALNTHAALDTWTPPSAVKVYEIGGWGADTLSGIEYYDRKKTRNPADGTVPAYRPMFVEDGDATVPIPSALLMPAASNITRYWLDLSAIALATPSLIPIHHSNLLESPQLRTFIETILRREPETLPPFLSKTAPSSLHLKKKLLFTLYGPASLHLYDSTGQHTGITESGTTENMVPGTSYGQLGEAQYILAPADEPYQVSLEGSGEGEASLEIDELDAGETVASTTITAIPITSDTQAALTVTNGIDDASSLAVDANGDGTAESTVPQDATSTPEIPNDTDPPVEATTTDPTPPNETPNDEDNTDAPPSETPPVTNSNSGGSSHHDSPTPEEPAPIQTSAPVVPAVSQEQEPEEAPPTNQDATSTAATTTTTEQVESEVIVSDPVLSEGKKKAAAAALLPVQEFLSAILTNILAALSSLLALILNVWK